MKLSLIYILGLVFGITFQTVGSVAKNDTTYIFLKDYGLYKTKKRNAIKYFYKALDDLKNDQPKVLVFSTGTYHFYPDGCIRKEYFESNTSDKNPKVCAFHFEDIKNLVIDGRGSQLIFHEEMQPFTFNNCQNITLKNVSIDWDQPLIAQAEVLRINEHYMDIGLNPKESPYTLREGKLFFYGSNKQENAWTRTMEFDRKGRYIVPQTGDEGCLGENWQDYHAEPTMPGILRLHHNFKRKPQVGNFLVLRHAARTHSGVFINESSNITIQNLRLYHATGLGILAQYSKNLTFNRYQAIPNRAKGRYFGGGDDGLQLSNCSGEIVVNSCTFQGLMDDPINVHGTSVQIQEIVSKNEVKCRFMHHQSVGLNWARRGDKISLIENNTMTLLGVNSTKAFKPLDNETFILELENELPLSVNPGDALENLTWTPNLTVSNNNFKNCRARGLLVSTPGKVLIENNTFESSGSAILIAGDANQWFETGAVTDVLIKNNTFTSLCNTSSYQFCEGIISIYPIIPSIDEKSNRFHQNIRIEHNHFHPFDYPILYALSVEGLSFSNNTITRSYDFEPYHNRHYTFTFEYCKQIKLINNQFSEDLLGKNMLLKKTPISELNTDTTRAFSIETY
ncbi:right-handed parallel beta-helix repeat-containing protein [uncultured Draconibacterium sp.]|uniref:right-handed parallel beta-helix repeat-containing protein n=1 Tax=uncultured Draconibacterium sp. TaxID=1573823 RepID=UPI003260973B